MADGYEKVNTGIVTAEGLGAVPDLRAKASAATRHRDVYTSDEVNLFDRCVAMLRAHGDRIQIRCGSDVCPDKLVTIEPDPTVETGAVLRCGCTDRVFERSKLGADAKARAAARRLRRGQKRLKR